MQVPRTKRRPKMKFTEGDIWPTSRAGPTSELSGERIEMEFKDLQNVPSLLANFISTAICAAETDDVIPAGVTNGNMRMRKDGPRFDLRMLMPRPATT